MNDPVPVRGRQPGKHLACQIEGERKRQTRRLFEQGRERATVQELHGHEEHTLGRTAEIEDIDDVRMADGAGRPRFAFEASG